MPQPEKIRDIVLENKFVFISWNKVRYKICVDSLKVREILGKKEGETNSSILLSSLLFKNS